MQTVLVVEDSKLLGTNSERILKKPDI